MTGIIPSLRNGNEKAENHIDYDFIRQIMSRGEYPGLNFCKKVLRSDLYTTLLRKKGLSKKVKIK